MASPLCELAVGPIDDRSITGLNHSRLSQAPPQQPCISSKRRQMAGAPNQAPKAKRARVRRAYLGETFHGYPIRSKVLTPEDEARAAALAGTELGGAMGFPCPYHAAKGTTAPQPLPSPFAAYSHAPLVVPMSQVMPLASHPATPAPSAGVHRFPLGKEAAAASSSQSVVAAPASFGPSPFAVAAEARKQQQQPEQQQLSTAAVVTDPPSSAASTPSRPGTPDLVAAAPRPDSSVVMSQLPQLRIPDSRFMPCRHDGSSAAGDPSSSKTPAARMRISKAAYDAKPRVQFAAPRDMPVQTVELMGTVPPAMQMGMQQDSKEIKQFVHSMSKRRMDVAGLLDGWLWEGVKPAVPTLDEPMVCCSAVISQLPTLLWEQMQQQKLLL